MVFFEEALIPFFGLLVSIALGLKARKLRKKVWYSYPENAVHEDVNGRTIEIP